MYAPRARKDSREEALAGAELVGAPIGSLRALQITRQPPHEGVVSRVTAPIELHRRRFWPFSREKLVHTPKIKFSDFFNGFGHRGASTDHHSALQRPGSVATSKVRG